MDAAEKFVASYLDAWNRQDPARVVDHLSDDGCYRDAPSQQQFAGDALLAHLADYFSSDRYRYGLLGDVLRNGDTLAFRYEVLPLTDGGCSRRWSGAEFIQLDGGVATQIEDFYRLPAPASRRAATPRESRYARSGLSDEAMAGLLDGLRRAMEVEHLYNDPDLSLPRLAEALGCSVNHLSQAINAGHSMSFFDYINQFRVAEAARLLRQEDCRFPAILDVALSVGFNSTSTFYTAFKKTTGQTPARYRRSQTGRSG